MHVYSILEKRDFPAKSRRLEGLMAVVEVTEEETDRTRNGDGEQIRHEARPNGSSRS